MATNQVEGLRISREDFAALQQRYLEAIITFAAATRVVTRRLKRGEMPTARELQQEEEAGRLVDELRRQVVAERRA
jgi:hypothetical protein